METNLVDDKASLAALDTEYQAAVKANDVVTMDRILADDFVLVTGVVPCLQRKICSPLPETRRWSTNIRKTPSRRYAFGEIRQLSPLYSGRRV